MDGQITLPKYTNSSCSTHNVTYCSVWEYSFHIGMCYSAFWCAVFTLGNSAVDESVIFTLEHTQYSSMLCSHFSRTLCFECAVFKLRSTFVFECVVFTLMDNRVFEYPVLTWRFPCVQCEVFLVVWRICLACSCASVCSIHIRHAPVSECTEFTLRPTFVFECITFILDHTVMFDCTAFARGQCWHWPMSLCLSAQYSNWATPLCLSVLVCSGINIMNQSAVQPSHSQNS
jgi:hypothetical protein